MKNKSLLQKLGLLGVVSLLSYTAAVIFAPLAYPGYDWMAQAVSDLSASNAPSKMLWDQLSSLYGVCGMISIMMVCVFIQGKLNKPLRVGIYLFAIMNWVSCVGYAMFPLSDSGNPGAFQDIMHVYVVTVLVVVLSIASLIVIMLGGYRDKRYRSLAIWAAAALLMMFIGAIGTNVVPKAYFGIPERFSVFAATGFNAVLGIYLFRGFGDADGSAQALLIKRLRRDEMDRALGLVWRVFLEYEAPDYTPEGVAEFYRSIHDDGYLSALSVYGAFFGEELVGIIATRNSGTHIALFFVDGKYHRQGIGRQLFEAVHADKMTVNSSPYAVPVYEKLGFTATGAEQVVNGLLFTPMALCQE